MYVVVQGGALNSMYLYRVAHLKVRTCTGWRT